MRPTSRPWSTTGKWRNLPVGHALHDAGDRLAFGAGQDLARHRLADRLVERRRAALGKRAHDVALRQNAGDAAVGAEDQHRADAFLGKTAATADAERAFGSMLTISRPLPARIMLTCHRSLPDLLRNARPGLLSCRRLAASIHPRCHDAMAISRMPAVISNRGRGTSSARCVQRNALRCCNANGSAACFGVEFRLRDRPDRKREQEQAGEKAADMRLPGDLLAGFAAERTVPRPNSAFSPSQTARNIRKRGSRNVASKRRRRHAIGGSSGAAPNAPSGPPC